MSLDSAALKKSLQDFLTSPPKSLDDAAMAWTNAYASYAQNAMAADAAPAITNTAILQGAMLSAMQSNQFLQQLPVALSAFWMTPPVIFSSPAFAGPVTATPGVGILGTTLSSIAGANLGGSSDPMGPIADALDAFTKTVIVGLINTATGATVPTALL